MRFWGVVGVAAVLLAVSAGSAAADVRITATTTLEGGFAEAMAGPSPRLTMRVKGARMRSDVDIDGGTFTGITDLNTRQFILLNAAQKTAEVLTPDAKVAPQPGPSLVDSSLEPTGRSRTIAGVPCDEFTVAMTMSMADLAGSAQPSEMLRNITLTVNGSAWMTKSGAGVAEFMAFQAAAAEAGMGKLIASIWGAGSSGFDRLMSIFATPAGVPYLTDLTVTIGGNDLIAEVIKGHGPMKVRTEVTEVSTDAIPDDTFSVPAGYKAIN